MPLTLAYTDINTANSIYIFYYSKINENYIYIYISFFAYLSISKGRKQLQLDRLRLQTT